MKTATLSPEGTFSHQAALKFQKEYEKDSRIVLTPTITDVFDLVVNKQVDSGIVPIENSYEGVVRETVRAMGKFDLYVIKEFSIPIQHHLAGWGDISDIKIIYSHLQTKAQCRDFLREKFNQAEIVETSSNGKSAEWLSKKRDNELYGAIVPKCAKSIYDLQFVDTCIQDSADNETRFLLLNTEHKNERHGESKTTLLVHPNNNEAGVLFSILKPFAERSINLTKIESMANGKIGQCTFFIDCVAHVNDSALLDALLYLTDNELAQVKCLGSYPRSC